MAEARIAHRLLVIGGSKGIGLATCRRALEEGHDVIAFSRNAKDLSLSHERLSKVNGNALDRESVAQALEGCTAVVQALGVPLSPKTVLEGTTLFSEATAVLLPAMQRAGIQRLVAVTGFGTGSSRDAVPAWQAPAFKAVFERIYRDKTIQERQIRETDLDWTIARPTILTNGRRTGRYAVLSEPDQFRGGRISRADVADFIVTAINDRAHIRQAPVLTR